MDSKNIISNGGPMILNVDQKLETPRRLSNFDTSCNLKSLPDYIAARKEEILNRQAERKDVLIMSDVDNCAIRVLEGVYGPEDFIEGQDLRNVRSVPVSSVTGSTAEHPDLEVIRRLCGYKMTPLELGNQLREMKRYFPKNSEGTHVGYDQVVTSLRQFDAKVSTEVRKIEDEHKGNMEDTLKMLIQTPDATGSFELAFRVLTGYGFVKSTFFVGRYPTARGVSVQLHNLDLDYWVESTKAALVKKALDEIKASLSGVPVLDVDLHA